MVKSLSTKTIAVHAGKLPNVMRRPYAIRVEGEPSTTRAMSGIRKYLTDNKIRVEISNI